MKLSVIIPFYKGEAFISDCVSSVTEAFNNCRHEGLALEMFIIIDSDAGIEQVQALITSQGMESGAINFIKNERNLGVASSRNKGLALATGDYVYLIDQDDKVAPDFFNKVVPLMLSSYDFILCNGQYHFVEKNFLIKIYYFRPAITLENIVLKDLIRSPGQVVVKREIISKYRFPVPQNHCGCDEKFCWILIFSKEPKLKTGYVEDCVYHATMHNSNYGINYKELYACGLELWDRMMAHNDAGKNLQSLYRKNTSFYKYRLGRLKTLPEKLNGLIESFRYHIHLNKMVSFMIKKASSL